MVKTRKDFQTEQEYKKYTRSVEFLESYSIEGKTIEELQVEMCFPKDWMHYIEQALAILKEKGEMQGMDLMYTVDHLVIEDEDYEASMKEDE